MTGFRRPTPDSSYLAGVEVAAAAGAAAGAAVAVAAAAVEDEVLPSLEELAAGLAEAYPSAYQPPPLKAIAGAETTRCSVPPQ